MLGVKLLHQGIYAIQIKARCDAGELAQVPMSIFMNHGVVITFTINGTQGEWVGTPPQIWENSVSRTSI